MFMYKNRFIKLTRNWWGGSAIVGGTLWAIKSVAILISGIQPDYIFELAIIPLALGSLGLAQHLVVGEPGIVVRHCDVKRKTIERHASLNSATP